MNIKDVCKLTTLALLLFELALRGGDLLMKFMMFWLPQLAQSALENVLKFIFNCC